MRSYGRTYETLFCVVVGALVARRALGQSQTIPAAGQARMTESIYDQATRRLATSTTTTVFVYTGGTEQENKAEAAEEAAEAARQAQLQRDVALHEAVSKRDLSAVRNLLAQNADINSQLQGGNVLYEAAASGRKDDATVTEFVKSLISMGADINYADPRGRTPLFVAAVQARNKDLVMAFQHADNKNPHKGYGVTALQLAVRAGDEDIVQALLEIGASKDQKDSRGDTAVTEADHTAFPGIRVMMGLSPYPPTTTTTTTTTAARRLSASTASVKATAKASLSDL